MPEPEDGPDELLAFVAAHELVVPAQVQALLSQPGAEVAVERLDALRERGMVSRVRVAAGSPPAYRVTPNGATLVDPALPDLAPLDLRSYRHDVAAGWVWLSVARGGFGAVDRGLSRREMQAADASGSSRGLLAGSGGLCFGAPLPGLRDRLPSYPDLGLVISPESPGWLGVHVQLSVPDRVWLRAVLDRYRSEPALMKALFLVDDRERVGEPIITLAEQLGVKTKVGVQLLHPDIAGG